MAKKKSERKLTPKQLEKYRQLLLDKRKELVGDVGSMEETIFQGSGELSSMPMHLADIGSDNFEQEFSLGLMAEGKKVLVEIDLALHRIEDGSFGICEGLGIPIETPRLEAIPWTRYSLEYARKLEKGHSPSSRPLDVDRQNDDAEDNDDEEIETDDADTEVPDTDKETLALPEDADEDDFDNKEEMDEKHIKE